MEYVLGRAPKTHRISAVNKSIFRDPSDHSINLSTARIDVCNDKSSEKKTRVGKNEAAGMRIWPLEQRKNHKHPYLEYICERNAISASVVL
jgi:hypothetical protein